MNRKHWLWFLVSVQALFLLGIAGSYYAIDWVGKDIRLHTTPVDPRDLLYGDYVELNYDISEASFDLWKGRRSESESLDNKPVYVLLTPTERVYRIKGIYPEKPDVSRSDVFLKAKATTLELDQKRIYLEYGLERFHVTENTGEKWGTNDNSLQAWVRVAPWGQAKLIRLEP